MKTLLQLLCIIAVVLAPACSSTSQRISKNEALFKTYTPAEQRLIRMGEVAVGFDQDQVRMALGEPSREATVETASGKRIAWEYREIKPSLGFGIGAGTGTGGSGIGTGVGVGVSPNRSRLLKRVIFDRQTGKVSEIETYD